MSDDYAIAVVGMACRFPGAPDLAAYWDLLDEGREGLTRFDDADLAAAGVAASLRRDPNYVPVGGVLTGQDEFDPGHFGFTAAEASLLDPQLRLLLETCWNALGDAGHPGGRDLGAVGVFTCASRSSYLEHNLAEHRRAAERDPMGALQAEMGTVTDYYPQQVAYRLGFTGPAIAVQATCASSLVAVHIAAQSLLVGECDAALAGGVSLIVPQGRGYLHVPDSVFSADGHTRTFAESASGMVHSQGVGAVVLRRLDDALADGDPIYAVLRGSAVNNDGAAKSGFNAPSMAARAQVIAEALAVAGVDADAVGMLEAHGTATVLGDQIELGALAAVFGADPRSAAPCALGSVKSNIGHTNTAAGLAGLIKTILALHHRRIPATLHADPVHPALVEHGELFAVTTRSREWPDYEGTRIAGVSSFGIGGTNCHVVVEQAPQLTAGDADERPQLLLVSGADEATCSAQLGSAAAEPAAVDDLAYTLHSGIGSARPHRAWAVLPAADGGAVEQGQGSVHEARPKIVFAFPGGGEQYSAMGAGLYRDEPVFAATVDECAAAMQPLLRYDIRRIVTGAAPPEDAGDTRYGQPALFAVSVAAAATLRAFGVEPDAVLGHSLGEYAAAVAAGMVEVADAARLVAIRSLGLAELAPGAMLAVRLGHAEVQGALTAHPQVRVAAINADDSCVISGPAAAIEALAARFDQSGVRVDRLPIDIAGHSAAAAAVAPALRSAAETVRFTSAEIALYSTATGGLVDTVDSEYWARQLREPARFATAVRAAASEHAVVVQVGPGSALATLARRNAPTGLRSTVTTFPDTGETADVRGERAALLAAVGRLWCAGVQPVASALHRRRRRVRLPAYPFHRRRLWVDPPREPQVQEVDPSIDFQLPVWRELPPLPAAGDRLRGTRWLVLGDDESSRERMTTGLADSGAIPLTESPSAATKALDGVIALFDCRDDAPSSTAAAALRLAGKTVRAVSDADGNRPVVLAVGYGSIGVSPAASESATATALTALGRVLTDESETRSRWVDLPTGTTDHDSAAVTAEAADLLGADTEAPYLDVVYRDMIRWHRHWSRWPIPPATTTVADAGSVVVLGGRGRLGGLIAEHLGARGATVILAGRSPGHKKDLVADITDPQAIRRLLDEVTARHGRIGLVVHAAGRVGTDSVAPLSEYGPDAGPDTNLLAKIAGTEALATAIDALDPAVRPGTVLLMSSVAGVVGGVGLGAYAVGNRFLDAYATRCRAGDHPRWVSVVWDAWSGQHDATPEPLAAAHSFPVEVEQALAAFDRIVISARDGQLPPVVAVTPRALEQAATRPARIRRTTQAIPNTEAGIHESLSDSGEALVAHVWSRLLGEPVTSAADDFFALGGHSVLATRMLQAVRDETDTDVRLRDLIAHPTVGEFARLVAQRGAAADARIVSAVKYDPGQPFPLTRVQHAYWVGRTGAFGLGDTACHFYLEYDCTGIDIDRYERAWNRAIDRHEMLRAIVTDDGNNRVLDEVPDYRIRRHGLADLPESEQRSRLDDLRRQLSHRVHQPDRWPLFDVRAAVLPDDRIRLFIGIDALICDSASYFVLDRDLRAFYDDETVDSVCELAPPRTRFADYVAHTEARVDTDRYRRAAVYWRDRMDELPGPPSLPTRTRSQTRPWFGRRRDRLDEQRWKMLRDQASRIGVTASAVLLTAYSDVLAAWSGDDRFAFMVTLVDRPSTLPDIDQVVGDFTTLLAHEVQHDGALAFADRARATQRRLFDDLDHRDYSALELMSDMASRTGRRHFLPVVFTSALDVAELTGAEPDLEWLGSVVHGVSQTPQVWLDHQAFTQAGSLQLQWDVLETVLDPEAADAAFVSYVDWLRCLADDPDTWTLAGAAPRPTAQTVDDIADALAAIWAEVLGIPVESIAPEATFVEAGGDSVLAVRMAAIVRNQLGITVPVTDLIGDFPLSKLAGHIGEQRAAPGVPRTTGAELARVADPHAPFPLTALQQAYWVGQHEGWALSYRSAHMYIDFRVSGIDPAAVGVAVRRLIERQPMLRAVFEPDGTQQVLAVDDPRLAHLPVTDIDLRSASAGEVDAAVSRVRADMQSGGPLFDPWPFAVTAIRLPGESLSLHIVGGLIVADGWSFQLLYSELFTYLDEPNTVLPPLTAHFGDYVETVARQRADAEWQAQRQWWTDRLDDLPTAPALPLRIPLTQARPDDMERREFRISGARMAILRQQCADHGSTLSTVFAAFYAIALARLAGHRRFLLNVLYLNRLHLPSELDDAIGPYAGTILVDIGLPQRLTFTDVCRVVQDAIGRTLDHAQVSGVEIARDLGRRRQDTSPQAPVVFHSTLGLHPPTTTPAAVRVEDFYQRVRTPQVALDLQVYEWDWDDEVIVNLDAVAELFAPGTLDDLFAEIHTGIDALIDTPDRWSEQVELPEVERAAVEAAPPTVTAAEPPVGPVESAVAVLWTQMLESELGPLAARVDRSTDFFALGGDSLMAIRMLTRLRNELGLIVEPRDFLLDPTLAATAAAAESSSKPGGPISEDIAVPLRDGTGAPLFLVHPTGGEVSCYLGLARALDTERPVVGIQDPALIGEIGPAGIVALAQRYAALIRQLQPAGPYLIGGWSMGGIVAHELARRLRAAGEDIALMALIDSNVADRIHDADGAEFWSRYLGSLEAFLDIDFGIHSGSAGLAELTESDRRTEVGRMLAEAGLLPKGDRTALAVREEVFRRHLRALGQHRTGRLDAASAQIVLITAEEPSPRNSGVGMGVDDCGDLPDLGWGAHTHGEISRHSVPAHHYALLRGPAVHTVADLLSRALSTVDVDSVRGKEQS
ncbi:type I polyketide synthase [Nocardia sp. CNY236]|uniref:type I polyketide synthase n=1 Tax=Nocardia sp. CNY236 TaxID=1169152 RepID=UPI0004202BAD|nr:type I polyketide synthase [Nocardia sp. CNY236]